MCYISQKFTEWEIGDGEDHVRTAWGSLAEGMSLEGVRGMKERWGCLFRRVAMRAARLWATWAAKTLAATLRQRLDADVALTSVTALRTWEDTLITQVTRPTSGSHPFDLLALSSCPQYDISTCATLLMHVYPVVVVVLCSHLPL